MASAILGGLRQQGVAAQQITVVDPGLEARLRLQERYGVRALEAADASLGQADVVVWAVKPQQFREAAAAAAPHVAGALHISVAAGITTATLARWFASQRIVRCMPNTPALIGQGMTGVYALPGVTAEDRALAEALIAGTGRWVWVADEAALDAVTALSGSGPAYVFYFLEAMQQAGVELGLTPEQARALAVGTFAGGAHLAAQSAEPLATLRERVTSKGGTTHAALTALEQAGVKAAFVKAMHAACVRAAELGDEFGRTPPH